MSVVCDLCPLSVTMTRFLTFQYKLCNQEFLSIKNGLLVEIVRFDRGVQLIESVHGMLYVCLVHLLEEGTNAFIVLLRVKHQETHSASCHKSRHIPFIEFVHLLEILK